MGVSVMLLEPSTHKPLTGFTNAAAEVTLDGCYEFSCTCGACSSFRLRKCVSYSPACWARWYSEVGAEKRLRELVAGAEDQQSGRRLPDVFRFFISNLAKHAFLCRYGEPYAMLTRFGQSSSQLRAAVSVVRGRAARRLDSRGLSGRPCARRADGPDASYGNSISKLRDASGAGECAFARIPTASARTHRILAARTRCG